MFIHSQISWCTNHNKRKNDEKLERIYEASTSLKAPARDYFSGRAMRLAAPVDQSYTADLRYLCVRTDFVLRYSTIG